MLRDAEVEGARVDVRVEEGTITMVEACGEVPGADVEIECAGGALLPGLHDHHLHLLSMAAAAASVDVSGGLDQAIRAAHAQARPGAPIRAVHYDEGRDGPLDRWRLDALAPGRATRVQHRSGALWVLSTVALPALVISGIYGMNLRGLPFLESDHGTEIVGGMMLVSTGIVLWMLKKFDWL